MIVLETILQSLRNAAAYNRHELAAPRVIVWPDEERLWLQCIESLRRVYPSLWSLGDYAPERATGPAVWLRYQLELHEGDALPVIYLPGIGRHSFRGADQFPKTAKHLFALQFQGQFWTQRNGKDWTPFAFLSTADGGLGLDVAADLETKKAIQECLPALLREKVAGLKGRRLEACDFRTIITPDPARTLLQWMGDPDKIKQEMALSGADWASFRAVCRDRYQFDPETDGAITAGEKLIGESPAWKLVWARYKEAPRAYPGIKEVLLTVTPRDLFVSVGEHLPQSNHNEESRLETELLSLSSVSQAEALAKIKVLASDHAPRAYWVWASLGDSPLALAIGHLRDLVEIVQNSGNPTTWEALADYYATTGWKADRSVWQTLNAARSAAATKAVTAAIRAVYLPWLEKFATLAQSVTSSYPTTRPDSCRNFPAEDGTVYLFVDGLRMDLGRRLEERLLASDLSIDVTFSSHWSALPTVTATTKPAWMPLAEKLRGPLEGVGFEPREKSNGKALNHSRFIQLMTEHKIFYLRPDQLELPSGSAWTEIGFVDTYGHDQGAKLAWRIEEELNDVLERIKELIQCGWSTVKVITDHGWLMLPGGLPKSELPKHLTVSRWSRCSIPGPGAQHGYPMTPWFWDAAEAVVLAPGVSCFVAGTEYSHGGLSMQEALVPSLTITAMQAVGGKSIAMMELKWVGMRLNVVFEGAQGFTIDLRSKVADATTSFIDHPIPAAGDGQKNSLLVINDEAMGTAAFLVVVDQTGQSIFKHSVVIGEN